MDTISPINFPSQMCLTCGSKLAGAVRVPQSPVVSHADTNISLSEQEKAWTKDAIDHADVIMAQIDADLERAQTLVDELQQKREEIERFSRVHRWILTSLRSLPNEILSEIFLYVKPLTTFDYGEHGDYNSEYIYGLIQAVLLPGQVCKRWRSAAISTKKLWSTIPLHFTQNKIEYQAQNASLWLERSDGCPLSVLMIPSTFNIGRLPLAPYIQEMIWAYCDMWIHLNIQNNSLGDGHYILDTVGSRLSCLESLSISLTGVCPQLVNIFEVAPKLKAVTICLSGQTLDTSTRFKLPWKQLSDLKLDYALEGEYLLGILRQCPNLQRCHLCPGFGHIPPVTAHQPEPAIVLQHLQSLVLFVNKNLDTKFLDHLLLPTLRDLKYIDGCHDDSEEWEGQPMVSLLSRSCCHLQKIAISSCDSMEVDDFIQILELTPHLEELNFDDASYIITRDSMSRLIADGRSDATILVPKLRVLEFSILCDDDGLIDDRFDLFMDMVESRWRPPGSFSHSQIQVSTTEHPLALSISNLESVSITMELSNEDLWIKRDIFERLSRLFDGGLSISCINRYYGKEMDFKAEYTKFLPAFEPRTVL